MRQVRDDIVEQHRDQAHLMSSDAVEAGEADLADPGEYYLQLPMDQLAKLAKHRVLKRLAEDCELTELVPEVLHTAA